MQLSIIIPTLNEGQTICSCLSALQPLRQQGCELIIVDGGSADNTVALASPLTDAISTTTAGRANQMNRGAGLAKADILLFLHADTFLPDLALPLITQHIGNGQQWGRFDIDLQGKHFMFKVISFLMNWRSRLSGIATGDQAIFVSKQLFNDIGQFPEISLMEDIALSKALRKISPPCCLHAKVLSSGRRWQKFGIYKTILLMWSLRLRYFFGADPDVLAYLYARGQFWKP